MFVVCLFFIKYLSKYKIQVLCALISVAVRYAASYMMVRSVILEEEVFWFSFEEWPACAYVKVESFYLLVLQVINTYKPR